MLVAGTVFASQLPWLLFALVSGAVVDRLDRRVVMLTANLFRACPMGLLGLLVLSEIESLVVVYVVVFLLGSAGPSSTARRSRSCPSSSTSRSLSEPTDHCRQP